MLAAPSAMALKFANQFVEFELPPQWQCNLEGAEWVCQSQDQKKKRDAIIILAAKLRGPQDTLEQYEIYLKKPKSYNSVKGKAVRSEMKYAKTLSISAQPWVDSLHLESEIPGFYTRYLATIKEDIGVLVTYSINKNKYNLYLNDFENLVRTLKVFRKTGGINAKPAESNLFDNTSIPSNVSQGTIFPGAVPEGADDTQAAAAKQPKKSGDSMFYILMAVVVLVLFIYLKRRRS